jgi:hypothetical protein
LGQRFVADVEGAAARDQQQPQCLAPLACPRKRERVAGERGPGVLDASNASSLPRSRSSPPGISPDFDELLRLPPYHHEANMSHATADRSHQ